MQEEFTIEELERDIKEREFLLGFKKFIEHYEQSKKTEIFLFDPYSKKKRIYFANSDFSMTVPLSDATKEFTDDMISIFNKHKQLLMSVGTIVKPY